MRKVRNLRLVGLALMLAAGVAALHAQTSSSATAIRLTLRGPRGERIQPSKVSLLFDWWGGNDVVDLPASGAVTRIDLDSAWVAAKWPNWSQMEGARLLVSANGYAPMLSETFAWLGQRADGGGTVAQTAIAFKDQKVAVTPGLQQDWTVTMRRPEARRLRFVDQNRRPAAGLGVAIYMYWTAQNHCGHFEGTPILQAKTDAQGRVTVPDGEFNYGVSIDGPSVFDGEPVFYQQVVVPDGPETIVPLHSFNSRTFTVRVVDGNTPVAGARFVGMDRYTGCMDSGIRLLGTTDGSGSIALRDFAADRYEAIAVCQGDRALWTGEPAVLSKSDRLDIVAAHTAVKTDVPPCGQISKSPNPQISKSLNRFR